MKKHLIAAAVAAAVAAPAMAQNVSLYGAMDASVMNIGKANGTGNISSAYIDGALASSVWGIRGSEDLGGGLRAVFQAEGDLMTNNGGTHTAGLFRRGAFVGVASANMGELTFGLRTNPVIAANGTLVPVGGNSVMTVAATVLGYADFFTRNAITYTTPAVNGFTAQVQHGLSNTVDAGSQGTVTAWRLSYAQGPFSAVAAAQARKSIAYSSAAMSSANTPTPGNSGLACTGGSTTAACTADGTEQLYSAATGLIGPNTIANKGPMNKDSLTKDTLLLGARYNTGPWALAVARIVNEVTASDGDSPSTGTGGLTLSATAGAKTKVSATTFGIGYQMSPALMLGASLLNAESSRLMNYQARYSLSKRTTAYAMFATADNDANGVVKFYPVAFNSGTAPAAVIGSANVGTADRKQTATGVGLIHTF